MVDTKVPTIVFLSVIFPQSVFQQLQATQLSTEFDNICSSLIGADIKGICNSRYNILNICALFQSVPNYLADIIEQNHIVPPQGCLPHGNRYDIIHNLSYDIFSA